MPTGQIHYFRSKIDDSLQPCAVCATPGGSDDTPRPLILEVSPGATNLEASLLMVEKLAGMAARGGLSCVALRPTGRGPGSLYQNYGEVDLLEAIEHIASVYHIDRQRISITGSSMGGAATWYLISHYPDLFAAAAPFCGYCDYRLWEKPGGFTFHMHPWEEPSWQGRSAALLVENLQHTAVWMVHGQWDRAVGGGVPVEHSRQMSRLMSERGIAHRYTEVPKTGHDCRSPEIWEQVVFWLLEQEKNREPNEIALASFDLRHNQSYWLRIEQFLTYGSRALVRGRINKEDVLVQTDNVRALSLRPTPTVKNINLFVDGENLGLFDLEEWTTFRRDDQGNWTSSTPPSGNQKRHRVSGPIGDLFFEGLILVPGTIGTEEEAFFNKLVADNARGYFASRNGGVHRGSIMGQNSVQLPVVNDTELSQEISADRNLLLYGTPASNLVLRALAEKIPLAFEGTTIRMGGKTYTATRAAVLAVFPHPQNPARYIAVHGGVTPDAITWGSHLDMMLLPDYIVYSGGEVLDWGFLDNHWKLL